MYYTKKKEFFAVVFVALAHDKVCIIYVRATIEITIEYRNQSTDRYYQNVYDAITNREPSRSKAQISISNQWNNSNKSYSHSLRACEFCQADCMPGLSVIREVYEIYDFQSKQN